MQGGVGGVALKSLIFAKYFPNNIKSHLGNPHQWSCCGLMGLISNFFLPYINICKGWIDSCCRGDCYCLSCGGGLMTDVVVINM